MSLRIVKELMAAFDASSIAKMTVKLEGVDLVLEKGGESQMSISAAAPLVAPQAPTRIVAKETAKTEAVVGTEVKSPIVGVFYPASSPEAEPYVKVGQQVKKGQTLCIIEAMKVMNEIPAPCDGVIAEIKVAREDLVEFDQVLMVIA